MINMVLMAIMPQPSKAIIISLSFFVVVLFGFVLFSSCCAQFFGGDLWCSFCVLPLFTWVHLHIPAPAFNTDTFYILSRTARKLKVVKANMFLSMGVWCHVLFLFRISLWVSFQQRQVTSGFYLNTIFFFFCSFRMENIAFSSANSRIFTLVFFSLCPSLF